MKIVAGLDIGSTAAKAVIVNAENKEILSSALIPSGWNAREAGEEVLERACKKIDAERNEIKSIVATGYGRVSLPFADKCVTEITCHALGASYLNPQTSLLLDIGGQDSKAIVVDSDGSVADFVMNDKCAAGTGRFLQVVANNLAMDLVELGKAAHKGRVIEISSMCAVFAETEIIGLLANGANPNDIARGVFVSIAKKVKTLIGRMPKGEHCTFTGGLAINEVFCQVLEEVLEMKVSVPNNPQCVGALGGALLATKL